MIVTELHKSGGMNDAAYEKVCGISIRLYALEYVKISKWLYIHIFTP